MRDEDSDIETGNGEGQAYRSHWWPNMQVLKIPDANSKTKVILMHTYANGKWESNEVLDSPNPRSNKQTNY